MNNEREIIRKMAQTILARVDDHKADTATMLAQCEQAVNLARAEFDDCTRAVQGDAVASF